MPKPPGMNSLSEILMRVMKNLSLDKALIQANVLSRWESIVGPAIASHAQPEQIRSRKLYVRVDSATWLQELTMVKPALIEKLNAVLGPDERMEEIVLRLGRKDSAPPSGEPFPTRMP